MKAATKSAVVEKNGDDLEVSQLSKEEIKTAKKYSRQEAMSLVGLYYSIQKSRMGARNKESAHQRNVDVLADPVLITRLKDELKKVEKQCSRGLKAFASAQPLGVWAMSNHGVGHVICAGLLAHIDMNRAVTAGAIWKFAGIIPPELIKWEKGQKRPYNAALKTLCWKLGESFKKVSGNPEAFYGKIYQERKAFEVAQNESGKLKEQAHKRLALAMKKGYKVSKEQVEIWESGKLQAMGLDLRAMRYTVKIFLSHYHTVGRTMMGLPLVKPWVLAHMPETHVHYIPPPNWPML